MLKKGAEDKKKKKKNKHSFWIGYSDRDERWKMETTEYTQNNKKKIQIKQTMFDMWQLLAECERQISNIFLIEITVVYNL